MITLVSKPLELPDGDGEPVPEDEPERLDELESGPEEDAPKPPGPPDAEPEESAPLALLVSVLWLWSVLSVAEPASPKT